MNVNPNRWPGRSGVIVSRSRPSTPSHGLQWFDETSGIEYTYVNDGAISGWMELSAPGLGSQGPSGTIAVGTVTTGAAGSSATIVNSGTSTAATFDFTIPKGDKGDTGNTGPIGPKSVTISNPTATEKIPLFFTTSAQTVSQIRSVLAGSNTPSVTFSIRYGSDFSATGTEIVTSGITVTNTTTGLSTTSFNNASVSANSFVWLTTSAKSGTVDSLHVSLVF